jgi:hypothetical protein
MQHAKFDLTYWCILAVITLSIAGCISTEQEFKNNLDAHINWNIERYQKDHGVDFIRSEETTDGKVDYFYEYTIQGLLDPKGSKSCYVMVVDKSSQAIVSWHFIGEDEYCRTSVNQPSDTGKQLSPDY